MLLALISGWRGLRGTSKLSLDRHHRYPPLQSAQGMGHPSVRNGLEKSKACATRQCEILLNFVWREGSRSVAITSTTVAEYRRPPRQCLLRFCPSRDGQVIRMEQNHAFPVSTWKVPASFPVLWKCRESKLPQRVFPPAVRLDHRGECISRIMA